MSCNCKRKIELENKYGEDEEMSILGKIMQKISRFLAILIFLICTILVTPIIILMMCYSVIFRKNNDIVLPKFMRKYMKNG